MSTELIHAYRLLIADVYEVAGASRSSSEQMAHGHGRTAAQWHVLSVLSDAELTVAAAARRLGLSRQAVQRVVNDLLTKGQLVSRPNPNDRRAPLVRVTDTGSRTLRQLFETSNAERADLLRRSGLEASDLQQARATLQRLLSTYRRDPVEDSTGRLRPRPAPAQQDGLDL